MHLSYTRKIAYSYRITSACIAPITQGHCAQVVVVLSVLLIARYLHLSNSEVSQPFQVSEPHPLLHGLRVGRN